MAASDASDPYSLSLFPPGHSLLHEFPQHIVTELLRDARPVVLAKGDVLFTRGDLGESCYLVRRGVIKVSIASSSGEQRIMTLHGRGAIVGELAMIDGLPRLVTAQAISDCQLAAITRAAFMACMAKHPEMSEALIKILVGRLRRSGEEAAWAGLLPAKARVARALLRVASVLGQPAGPGHISIDRGVTHADIAALAGVSREVASRAIGAWKRTGAMSGDPHAAFVVDVRALQAEADDGTSD
ncbi:MAG: Crp/Fnr family transcriptional regulator [Reyranella sp.]|nr:Crp/Fnr family transcriptional regulator [Reyranella sp.]MBL6651733.1 Crp/Fnr family transcriptional regulator [Reyranella sp.]